MLSHLYLRYITFSVTNLLKNDSSSALKKIGSCNFATSSILGQQKKKRKKRKWGWGKGNEEDDEFKIVVPQNCATRPDPVSDPLCKVAIVIGGGENFGFAAADQFLCKGARAVIVVDANADTGKSATEKLCASYGKDRAKFFQCDKTNECQFEGIFFKVLRKYKKIDILFNDLDKRTGGHRSSNNENLEWNDTMRAVHIGMRHMGKQNGGQGGIIVNSASILGFMGWPENPVPVYCFEEPVIETTMNLALEYPVEKTGVRLITLCPTSRTFNTIGLDIPKDPSYRNCESPPCVPVSKSRIGTALSHVIAWAKSGSTWVVEPSPCLNEIPHLVHFPLRKGEKVDRKVYEKKQCPVAVEPHCAAISEGKCPSNKTDNCQHKKKKEK